jgi:hypothetical protein
MYQEVDIRYIVTRSRARSIIFARTSTAKRGQMENLSRRVGAISVAKCC